MKLKKSQIKEFIRQAISEVISEDIMDKEIENPKTGNKIKVRTALQLPDEHPANKKAKGMVAKSSIDKDDVGGPAYPNVKKGVKTSKQAKGDDKEKSKPKKGKIKSDPFSKDDVGGPAHPNVPKKEKPVSDEEAAQKLKKIGDSDKLRDLQKKLEGKASAVEKKYGYNSDEMEDAMQKVNSAKEARDFIENAYGAYSDYGEFDDKFSNMYEKGDFDSKYTKSLVKKSLQKAGIESVFDKSKDDDSMKAAKSSNKKMEIDVLNKDADKGDGAQIDTENGTVTWTSGDPDEDTFFATNEDGEEIEVDYNDIVRFHNDNDSIMKNLRKESIKRRFTVKEVRTWMKKLEENRYKKVYNSDARRVSWMVNHVGESVENMPKSMRKKWTKAAYGRERYLAKEFLKSKAEQLKEMVEEIKLRKVIRKTIIEQLNKGKLTEDKFIAFYKKERVTVNAKSLWDAKKQIIAKLKVPKKDVGLVSVLNKTEYDKQKFRFEGKLKEAISHMDMRILYVPKKDFKKSQKLLKMNIMRGQVEVEKKPSSKVKGFYRFITTKKLFDEVVEWLAEAGVGVKTIAKGKM